MLWSKSPRTCTKAALTLMLLPPWLCPWPRSLASSTLERSWTSWLCLVWWTSPLNDPYVFGFDEICAGGCGFGDEWECPWLPPPWLWVCWCNVVPSLKRHQLIMDIGYSFSLSLIDSKLIYVAYNRDIFCWLLVYLALFNSHPYLILPDRVRNNLQL